MKTIGIADFKKLVMERLANPRDYADRSLVLWNADYNKYGIAYRVIKQCCEMYNKENPNDQIWFTYSDMCFASDDYTKPTCLHEEYVKNENGEGYHLHVEENRCGILFNTGCYMLFEKEDWMKLVNSHTNQMGGVYQDCAVIICAQADQLAYRGTNDKFILKEEQFGKNCDIYSIQPTFDEWITWVTPDCHPEILKVVRAFIEKNGVKHEPYGFDLWQGLIDSLHNLVEESNCPLNQIPKEEVDLDLKGSFGTKNQTVNEFIDFIYEPTQLLTDDDDEKYVLNVDDLDFDDIDYSDEDKPEKQFEKNPNDDFDWDSIDWDSIKQDGNKIEKQKSNSDSEDESAEQMVEDKPEPIVKMQVKLFEPRFGEDIEMSINQFLQEKANSIKVIDIKYTTPVTTNAHKWKWTAMVIYETL